MAEKKKRSKLKVILIALGIAAIIIFSSPEYKAKFLKIIGMGEDTSSEVETPAETTESENNE
jgi:hypothetical protein|tara:strand:- start:6718 stop:6903 length:186 start_codon:yes stop_codon:yes gene_type:complete